MFSGNFGPRVASFLLLALFATFRIEAKGGKQVTETHKPPIFQIRKVDPVVVSASPGPTRREEDHIRELIRGLVKIDNPDFGLSPTMSGTAFAPIPGTEQAGAMILMNHGLQRSSNVTELVKLGPADLPFLLEAL